MATIDEDSEIRKREKIAKEIARTSEVIRKKYRALKTGKMEEDVALEKHFKPIIEPLQKIVNHTIENSGNSHIWKDESIVHDVDTETLAAEKEKREDVTRNNNNRKRKFTSLDKSSTPHRSNQSKPKRKHTPMDVSLITSTPNTEMGITMQPRRIHFEQANELEQDVSQTTNESYMTPLRDQLDTPNHREVLQSRFGPLGEKYIGAILGSDENQSIDSVYGVYFENGKMMLGDKLFNIATDDSIIINGAKYVGTPGLYELIFKKVPDIAMYTTDDMRNYKHILLTTNAHRRYHNAQNPISGNKGHKYKHVIAPLISVTRTRKKSGKGLFVPRAMTLTDNKIDYIHWNDPNELVDRLRLLEASRQAGNNAHDNEILSIVEELREAGIIN